MGKGASVCRTPFQGACPSIGRLWGMGVSRQEQRIAGVSGHPGGRLGSLERSCLNENPWRSAGRAAGRQDSEPPSAPSRAQDACWVGKEQLLPLSGSQSRGASCWAWTDYLPTTDSREPMSGGGVGQLGSQPALQMSPGHRGPEDANCTSHPRSPRTLRTRPGQKSGPLPDQALFPPSSSFPPPLGADSKSPRSAMLETTGLDSRHLKNYPLSK